MALSNSTKVPSTVIRWCHVKKKIISLLLELVYIVGYTTNTPGAQQYAHYKHSVLQWLSRARNRWCGLTIYFCSVQFLLWQFIIHLERQTVCILQSWHHIELTCAPLHYHYKAVTQSTAAALCVTAGFYTAFHNQQLNRKERNAEEKRDRLYHSRREWGTRAGGEASGGQVEHKRKLIEWLAVFSIHVSVFRLEEEVVKGVKPQTRAHAKEPWKRLLLQYVQHLIFTIEHVTHH